jgi:hypothetical protein
LAFATFSPLLLKLNTQQSTHKQHNNQLFFSLNEQQTTHKNQYTKINTQTANNTLDVWSDLL